MGDLVRMPLSEVTATLEILDCWGVEPQHLAQFRGASSYFQQKIAQAIISSDEKFFANTPAAGNAAEPPTIPLSSVLAIDRSQLFSPAEFIGAGWSIWKGPANGSGLEGDEEQDGRSLALAEVDLSQVRFETTLKSREDHVGGEEKLKRLKKTGHIRLDAKVFQTLWQNQSLIPESWKKKINGNIRYIFFDGTILRRPYGDRFVLCLYWRGGRWYWFYYWLGRSFRVYGPSAVLAS